MPLIKNYVFALLCFSAFLACTNKKDEDWLLKNPAITRDFDSIQHKGTLTALIDNNSISYFLYRGQGKGFDYELLQRFAKAKNLKLKLKLISGVENGIRLLNAGEGDILAFPLTITKEREEWVAFTQPLLQTHQVLVQKVSENDSLNQLKISSLKQLNGKSIHVLKRSSFVNRLQEIESKLQIDVTIIEDSANAATESLIQEVANGKIEFTVTDEIIGRVNKVYHPELDVSVPISDAEPIAWAVRKNSPILLKELNNWIASTKKESTFMVIYNRYFNSPRTAYKRGTSKYATITGNQLSAYDDIIKKAAAKINWDWRLLAAIVFEESKFINKQESWAGARGLMQLMPATAQRFGASNPDDPAQNIMAGAKFLKSLEKHWEKSVTDSVTRMKLVFASYNVGLSHLIDARKLAIRYKEDPNNWTVIEKYLLLKSEPTYYKDPVVLAGYCKCEEPIRYAQRVLDRYEEYRAHL
jgi:membrane-bound lytic murein transglycosylase F